MKHFITEYKIPVQGTYGSYIIAPDNDAAERLATVRGLGETIRSIGSSITRTLPDPLSRGFNHWLFFCAYIAQRSGLYDMEILSDTGAIHAMSHYSLALADYEQGKHHVWSEWNIAEGEMRDVWAAYQKLLVDIGFSHQGEVTKFLRGFDT